MQKRETQKLIQRALEYQSPIKTVAIWYPVTSPVYIKPTIKNMVEALSPLVIPAPGHEQPYFLTKDQLWDRGFYINNPQLFQRVLSFMGYKSHRSTGGIIIHIGFKIKPLE